MTIKTFIMLQKLFISYKGGSFERFDNERILKRIIPQKYSSAQPFSTLIIIRNIHSE